MAVRRRPRSRSSLAWAIVTVAPWAVASALLVSFTADAGQEAVIGVTRLDLDALAPGLPDRLVPGAGLEGPDLLANSSDPARNPAEEVEPRLVRKVVPREGGDREGAPRHDPDVLVRPTFAAAFRPEAGLAPWRRIALAFGDADADVEPADFEPIPVDAPLPELGTLSPLPASVTITTRHTGSARSPGAAAGDTTPHVQDGSTPGVSRAQSLASATPAPADATPIAVAALPKFSRGPGGLVTSDTPVVGVAPDHPDYGALIQSARAPAEQRCLAEAVYFEARSEPEEGQAAVAQVVLNRTLSGLYPGSVCGVVFQNQQRRNACQFSFACEGHALHITEEAAWARAQRIAAEVTDGAAYVSDVGASTHYHATYVRPFWAHTLRRTDAIGHHIFYAPKPGNG